MDALIAAMAQVGCEEFYGPEDEWPDPDDHDPTPDPGPEPEPTPMPDDDEDVPF